MRPSSQWAPLPPRSRPSDSSRTAVLVILVGIPKWTETLPLPLAACVARELKLVGSMMGSACLATDVPRLVRLYEAGRLKLDELVTGRYALDDINEAVASTRSGAALRNVIVF